MNFKMATGSIKSGEVDLLSVGGVWAGVPLRRAWPEAVLFKPKCGGRTERCYQWKKWHWRSLGRKEAGMCGKWPEASVAGCMGPGKV